MRAVRAWPSIAHTAACFVLLGVACGGSVAEGGGRAADGGAAGHGATSGAGGTSGGVITGGRAGGSSGTSSGSGGATDAGTAGAGATANDGGWIDPCGMPPDGGPCFGAAQRFYFDAAAGECREFLYGGCEGNANNFTTLEKCQTYCQHRADGCQLCRGDVCSDYDCRSCPMTRDSHGRFCDVPGLSCSFLPQPCEANTCTCTTSNTWECFANLC